MTRRLIPALLAPFLLLLTGCFAVETSYEVNEDGSGTQTMRVAIPPEVATSFGEELPSVDEMQEDAELDALREALGEDGEIEFFSNQEDGVGFVMTLRVDASDDMGAALAAQAERVRAALPEDEDTAMMFQMAGSTPTIRRDGDVWTFQQDTALDPAMLSEMGGGEEAAFLGMFLSQTTIVVRLSLPGEVIEHNADEVTDDGTLVWRQTGADGARLLTARSDISGGGLPTLALAGLLVGGIAVVLVLAGLLLFGRRRR